MKTLIQTLDVVVKNVYKNASKRTYQSHFTNQNRIDLFNFLKWITGLSVASRMLERGYSTIAMLVNC